MFLGGVRFDLTACLYLSLPYLIMVLLPLRIRETKAWRLVAKILFVTLNFVGIVANLCDQVYYPFTLKRTTWTIFEEFGAEKNLGGIFLHEAITHWYLVLMGLAMLAALIFLYREPKKEGRPYRGKDYLAHSLVLLLLLVPVVSGLRGGLTTWRPISLNDANKYCSAPTQTAIVLNTSFSILRTMGRHGFPEPVWFPEEEARKLFDPVKTPSDTAQFRSKNVVIFILESFSAAYSEFLTGWQGKEYEGYMPFLDSLMQESLVFRHSFAHERQSICALSAVMTSLPSVVMPYILSSYANDNLSGLVTELVENKGYSSAFYHPCSKVSLGITSFAGTLGFKELYNMEDFGDDSQYDGFWGIWDEPFLDYFEKGISRMQEPFIASIFTASSHHPYNVPPGYEERFPEGRIPMHKCIKYVDNALKEFFEKARKEPWYDNTVFVFTGDHCNDVDQPEYYPSMGMYLVPILFYAPDGSLKAQRNGVAQQTDIQPTVLSYLGYDRPYVSFGCDLLSTPDEDTFGFVDFHGLYQYFRDGYQFQFNGTDPVALYSMDDMFQSENLLESEPERAAVMEDNLKAFLQQLLNRIVHNRLTVQKD